MLRRIRADLHVHTCLSPCADLQMSPQKIAAQACKRNIGILAVCDHNSAENVRGVMQAATSADVVVLPGMEVCTKEEIHLLALFENIEPALALQALVYEHLAGENDPDVFGLQVVASERDEVIRFENRLLIGAVDLPVDMIVSEIHRLGGLVIASHVDRGSYSVISQLGFIPDTLKFDALELSGDVQDREAKRRYTPAGVFTFIRNSDAHMLDDVGRNASTYLLDTPSFSEIRKALKGEDGRLVCEP